MVDFDLAGKPCGNGNACRSGYSCVEELCEPDDEVGLDAGRKDSGTSLDSGTTSADSGMARDSGSADTGH
jgi:hypothetical protein